MTQSHKNVKFSGTAITKIEKSGAVLGSNKFYVPQNKGPKRVQRPKRAHGSAVQTSSTD